MHEAHQSNDEVTCDDIRHYITLDDRNVPEEATFLGIAASGVECALPATTNTRPTMATETVRAQLKTLGIDDGLIRDIMNSVQPDPITGKIGIEALMKYIMESKSPQMSAALQNGARLVEAQRRETAIDWTKVDFIRLPVQENVTWWLRVTTLADGGTQREPTRFMLECMTYGNRIDAPRLVDKYKSLPTPEELLHFIRRCIAKPLPGFDPCIPTILIIQRDFQKHAPILKSFLDTLPSPFSWAVESEAASLRTLSIFSWEIPLDMAKKSKTRGNQLYSDGQRSAAILAYGDAIDRLMNAFRSDPSKEKNREAEKLLAVCLANRSAAYLMTAATDADGGDENSDLHEAWKDGQVAIRVDPTYVKGYLRVSSAHHRLGHLRKAQETLANGLRRPDLENDPSLVDRLILLQTDGKGFPNNEEEFLAWQELVLVEDEESAKMMKGIDGLWKKRAHQHLKKLQSSREG
ncbi:hypothetical protein NP233_g686 [Leucocoprinus birnbaumii]|uniref:Uncharacterized protein n=1 Tax=Leucocoprinus birnbaumii TaxID=56174 RepID=A0AAD5YWI0_9AGAR|nr:hypothetical protein NP233_g686 [Leucocoprinus birnbaumii]